MKTLYADLKQFWITNYKPKLYFSVIVLNIILILFNYSIDFEDSYLDYYMHSWLHILFLGAFSGIAFLITSLIIYFNDKKADFLHKKEFWVKLILFTALIGLNRGFFFHRNYVTTLDTQIMVFVYKCLNNITGVFTILIPLFFYYTWFDKGKTAIFYGLNGTTKRLNSLWVMFLIVLVLVFLAALFTEMSEYYPMYQRSKGDLFAKYYHINEWIAVFIYEMFYAIDFINVELLFRGFLVLGFVKLLGANAILPMVTVYSVLHFGKPLAETISSIFGAYILGVFAYKYKHIWLGVVLHVGLALLMEVFGKLF